MEQYTMDKMYSEVVSSHFNGKRHGGISAWDTTEVVREVMRETFPDAVGLAVRGSDIILHFDTTEENFSWQEVQAMVICHCRGYEC